MIIDQLQNASRYPGLDARILAALRYLEQLDLDTLEAGDTEIDGRNLYMLVRDYKTRLAENGRWEAHRVYADVQYVARGRERMGYAPAVGMRDLDEYNAQKDVWHLTGPGSFVTMNQGDFAIFGPGEVHQPMIALEQGPEPVQKVVIKVKM